MPAELRLMEEIWERRTENLHTINLSRNIVIKNYGLGEGIAKVHTNINIHTCINTYMCRYICTYTKICMWVYIWL